jgi:hypothetical protein
MRAISLWYHVCTEARNPQDAALSALNQITATGI